MLVRDIKTNILLFIYCATVPSGSWPRHLRGIWITQNDTPQSVVISSSQRPLPENTQHSQQTDIPDSSGIRAHNLSRRVAPYLRLRPRGHWDLQYFMRQTKHLRDLRFS
jgi:hypothetical protein